MQELMTRLRSGGTTISIHPSSGKIVGISLDGSGELLLERPDDAGDEIVSCGPSVDDRFDVRRAWGFDECFPTVGGFPAAGLRDHGWLWGAPLRMSSGGVSELLSVWSSPSGVCFERRVTALPLEAGECGSFCFELDYLPLVPLLGEHGRSPNSCLALYAAHALFAMETGDELQVWDCREESCPTFVWGAVFPDAADRQAQKLYLTGVGRLEARLFRRSLGVEIQIRCGRQLNYMGIWWCNNGWGDGREHRTVGIEPTSHPSDGPVLAAPMGDSRDQEPVRASFSLRVLSGARSSWHY
jgi:hypothetical protein